MKRTASVASPSRRRLLILTDTPVLVAGGSERFLRNLLKLLPADRYEPTLVQLCEEPDAESRLHDAPWAPNVRVLYMPVRAVYGTSGMRALRKLRKLMRDEGFHVIQSQHEKSDVLNALLPRGPAKASRISSRRDTGFAKSTALRAAFRLLNGRYDRIVAPAKVILDIVARDERGDATRMRWIPNGVDATHFTPVDGARREAMRRDCGYDANDFVIGIVASLRPVKRHTDLIAAFAEVHRQRPNARLLLIGDGEMRGDIERQIAHEGIGNAVRLLGDRADVAGVLPALDVFVLTSSTEGMSNAILEAMACGLPVVATNVGGNPDLVVPGETGFLVPPASPAALAAALSKLADDADLRARFGAAARARVEAEFSLQRMAGAFESLYDELAPVPHAS